MRSPKDYDFPFTAKGINYYIGVVMTDEYELQIIKQNPTTQSWDEIVVGWGTGTLYDLENKYTVEEMVGYMCKIFNERILGIKEGEEEPVPDGLPEAIKALMEFIRDQLAFDEVKGLHVK